MPFYPNQRCQRCYQPSGCSVRRPVPEPQQQLMESCSSYNCSSVSDSNHSECTVPANRSSSGNHSISGSDCPCHRADTCEHHQTMPEDPVIAMAYVPWQRWANLSNRTKALQQGTIFADLNKPFSGKGGHCR